VTDDQHLVKLRGHALSWRTVGAEILAIDEQTWDYFSVRGAGVELWEHLSQHGSTPNALAQQLVESYAIDSAQASQDVRDFLDQLASRNLLEP
jgi:hypothetical protein